MIVRWLFRCNLNDFALEVRKKIILEKRQNLYFTSDTHYNHTNICRGVSKWPEGRGTRDFHSLGEMNSAIVSGINSVVGPDDVLVHLGDWSFGGFESIAEFRKKILCKNVILFLGNHDHHIIAYLIYDRPG